MEVLSTGLLTHFNLPSGFISRVIKNHVQQMRTAVILNNNALYSYGMVPEMENLMVTVQLATIGMNQFVLRKRLGVPEI